MLTYVETFRARRALSWTLAIVVGVFSVSEAILVQQTHGAVHAHGTSSGIFPLSVYIAGSGFVALILATVLGTSLSAQRPAIVTLWTLPVPRERIVLGHLVVDLVAVALAWAGTLAAALIGTAIFHLLPFVYPDEGMPYEIVATAGAIVMWYGLLQLITARLTERAGMIAGFSWLFAFADAGTAKAASQPQLHALGAALIWINPLAYVPGQSSSGGGPVVRETLVGLDPISAALLSLAIGIVALGAATLSWRRAEV